MSKGIQILTALAVALLAIIPFSFTALEDVRSGLGLVVITMSNAIAWSVVGAFLFSRAKLNQKISRTAREFGINPRYKSLEKLIASLVAEISRKNEAFTVNLVERRITSKEELSRTLERIVQLAYSLLSADSAELALFDKESGLYHSSFVLGKPFRSSAQAMLAGAMEGRDKENPADVLIQPIAFAGSVLGSLRVALKRGTVPSPGDQEIIRLLALQGGLALINAQYTEQLLRMRQASDESVKAKTGFLANLSHEIRGPLGIMLNAVELVVDGLCGPVNEDQLDTLKMVRQNGEHLLELINDVLDYAKIESGRMTPHAVEISVDELLQDITNVVRAQAEAKKHKLVFKPLNDALAFRCDRRHARQMLINLLTNAIKYTPDGGNIEVWAERVPGNKVRLSVKDSGVGIGSSDRHKVFAAFERIENAYSLKQVGSGLGMPLTKRLAELNNALIDFKSSPGQGSTFWLVFQAVEMTSASITEEAKTQKEAKGEGQAILLLQKEDGERNLLSRYLEHIGFNPLCAHSQLEAGEIIRNADIKLLLLDNSVVDTSWEDLLSALSKEIGGRKIPIMLVTSRAFVFDIEKYLKLGIDRCLIKPIELKKMGVICRELIDGTHSGQIIDEEELSNHDKKKKRIDLSSTKVMELDDILH